MKTTQSSFQSKGSWLLLSALSIMVFLINVDYTAVNMALIPIATQFHANLNIIQWLLTAYVLAWAVLVIPAGIYSDRYRKKSFCVFGLLLFVLASLLAGLAHSISYLIIARTLQGVAGAMYVPTLYALLFLNFREEERGRAMGLLSLGVGLGMAMGPFIGGALLSWFDWRSIFFINIPIGITAAIIIWKNKEIKPSIETNTVVRNKLSAFLLAVTLVGTLYLLTQWRLWSSLADWFLGLMFIVIMSGGLFLYLQSKLAHPLLPLKIFSNLNFSGCCIGIFLEQYAFSTIIVGSGIYLQKILALSTLESSVIYLFLTVIFGVIAAWGGAWIDRVGLRRPVLIGLFILMIGSLLFATFTVSTSYWIVYVVLTLIGVGMGLAFSALNAGMVKTVSSEFIGLGSSLFVMLALLGNALGVTFTAMLYEKLSYLKLQQIISSFGVLNFSQTQQLTHYIANIGVLHFDLSAFNLKAQQVISNHLQASLSHGLSMVMVVNALVCLLAFGYCYRWIKVGATYYVESEPVIQE